MNKHPPPIDTTVPDVGVCKRNNAMYTMCVVKECLGLMSTEDRAALLVYFKILLELPPSYVSSLITGALYKLCLSPSLPAELSPEFLLDLVCSICLSVSQHKTGFAMKTMAGLLSSGVPKVYSFNKQMCEIKLPIVFDALIVLLEQSELQNFLDTGHAFSCLIAYIDESLIKPGVDRTLMHANREDVGSQSVPTLIEKLCASFPKLLHSYRSTDHWYLVLELVSTMIDKLGIYSSFLTRDTVKTLADIHKLPDKGFSFQEEVKPLLEKFVEKCGLDAITAVIPQEHIQLLTEINDQLGSKSVEAKATISGHNLYQSKSRNNDPVEQCRYSKRKMNDRESMSRRQNRAALAKLVKGKAKHALRGGVLGAVRMTMKLKL